MVDMKAFADVVAQAIDVATAPLLARIAVLEKRVPMPGRDGKDAPAVDLEVVALKAAALVPLPKDGRDATPVDLDVVALKAAALIPKPVDGRDAPAVDIEAIAVKAAALIPKPEPGRDGKDAPAVDLDALAVKAAALVPKPRDGMDGKDAQPVDIEALATKAAQHVMPFDYDEAAKRSVETHALPAFRRVIENDLETVRVGLKANIADAIAAIRPPRDGKDGKDVDAAMLETIVSAHVERAVTAIPRPLDGKSLTPEDVAPLIQAEVTKAAAALTSGRDGIGVSGAVIDHAGVLRLTLSDGKSLECGPVRGARGADVDMELVRKSISDEVAKIPQPKDGEDGKPGVDGLGFDDLDVVMNDEKGLIWRFSRGEHVKEFAFPWLADRGVYRPGILYRKASCVTAQGSLWIAQADTRERPGDGSTAWRLAVKKGRDGKDGKDAKDEDHG